ncbi:hypothetical protein [Amycolatopsis sacchari]|uniref:hypothetical protein n=1 Tax=Amycolatopsis sacchari TaxID=115433 RepID=UPI00117835AD|nr:hypothetical protein [Amycolatopsis sacchari]
MAAFRLSEEQAAGGYLAARKEMVRLATRVASLRQLVREQPGRAGYRVALAAAEDAHRAAVTRTGLAFERWQAAQLRSDAVWSETFGRAA